MNRISLITFTCAIALSFGACKQSEQTKEEGISTDVIGSTAQFTFNEESHDFGKIIDGEKVSWSFRFKNTGSSELVISSAHGSCGCTVPKWPKEPIPVGAESSIDVTFDSDGKSGVVHKTVTLVANTNPNRKVLNISAEILPKEESKEN